jgi:DNA-binding transcriptional ArsR family regulator/uncharacterized protein YndB with AHSA1/START domain
MPRRPAAANVWKALADPTRRRLLDLLRRRPRTTGQLAQRFPKLSRFAVMKHLGVLARADLVIVRRDGRRRWTHLNAVPLRLLYERWVGGYADHWAGSLVGLKKLVESRQPEGGAAVSADNAKHPAAAPFHIEQEVLIRAPRARVFDALTRDIAQWWIFRLMQEGSTLVLEPRVGGRFFEDLGDGQGALWGIVQHIKRPEVLRLNGALGMMRDPVVSVYTYELVETEDGATRLKLTHRVAGEPAPHAEENYRGGWGKLLGRYLKAYVEEGKRYTELGDPPYKPSTSN